MSLRAALVLLVSLATAAHAAGPSTAWKEVEIPGEREQFANAAATVNRMQQEESKATKGVLMHGFHAKSHASVRAEFKVLDGLPEHARNGLFGAPGTYQAWVRFSNGLGFLQRDRRGDIRGAAIKVVGVPGAKLMPGEPGPTNQDFTFHNVPAQLARDTKQIMALAGAGHNPLGIYPHLLKELGVKEATRIAAYLMKSTQRKLGSIATESYWSGGAIQLGKYAVKYMMKPTHAAKASYVPFGPSEYLRDEFTARLKATDITFDFYVQFFIDEQKTPIEDDTVEWDSPFVKVAELTIRKRDLDTAEGKSERAFGESLAYTPWHGRADMRPLGHMNRSRLAIYSASARLRLGRASVEPTGAESFK